MAGVWRDETDRNTKGAKPKQQSNKKGLTPFIRITNYKGRTLIAFDVNAQLVSIIGLFYGGQDYEAALQDDAEDDG